MSKPKVNIVGYLTHENFWDQMLLEFPKATSAFFKSLKKFNVWGDAFDELPYLYQLGMIYDFIVPRSGWTEELVENTMDIDKARMYIPKCFAEIEKRLEGKK